MSAGAIAARANRQAAADRRQLRLQRTQHFALRAFGWLLLSVVLLIALFPPTS